MNNVAFQIYGLKKGIVQDGLILNLDAGNTSSYPGTGTVWTDLTGNGNNGTLINGPTFDSGNGGSIVFDGVNDYASCGNSSGLQTTVGSAFTWVNTTTPGSSYRSIIAKQFAWGLFTYEGVLITYDWSGPGIRSTDINIADGTWKSVAMTFTEITGTPLNNAILYLNGSPVLTTTIKLSTFGNVNLEIGRGGSYAAGLSQLLNGRISNSQVYNRVLTPAEVLQNYNATKGRFGL